TVPPTPGGHPGLGWPPVVRLVLLGDEEVVGLVRRSGECGQATPSREQTQYDRAVDPDTALVYVALGRRADPGPAERVVDLVTVGPRERARVPVRVAGGRRARDFLEAVGLRGERATPPTV